MLVPLLVGIDGHAALEGPIEEVARSEARQADDLLKDLGIPVQLAYSLCLLVFLFFQFSLFSCFLCNCLMNEFIMNISGGISLPYCALLPWIYLYHHQILFSTRVWMDNGHYTCYKLCFL